MVEMLEAVLGARDAGQRQTLERAKLAVEGGIAYDEGSSPLKPWPFSGSIQAQVAHHARDGHETRVVLFAITDECVCHRLCFQGPGKQELNAGLRAKMGICKRLLATENINARRRSFKAHR